MVTFSKGYSNI